MAKEEKTLLLRDLCARLPYKVKVCLYEKETCILMGIDGYEVYLDVDSDSFRIESIKPYKTMSGFHPETYKITLGDIEATARFFYDLGLKRAMEEKPTFYEIEIINKG